MPPSASLIGTPPRRSQPAARVALAALGDNVASACNGSGSRRAAHVASSQATPPRSRQRPSSSRRERPPTAEPARCCGRDGGAGVELAWGPTPGGARGPAPAPTIQIIVQSVTICPPAWRGDAWPSRCRWSQPFEGTGAVTVAARRRRQLDSVRALGVTSRVVSGQPTSARPSDNTFTRCGRVAVEPVSPLMNGREVLRAIAARVSVRRWS